MQASGSCTRADRDARSSSRDAPSAQRVYPRGVSGPQRRPLAKRRAPSGGRKPESGDEQGAGDDEQHREAGCRRRGRRIRARAVHVLALAVRARIAPPRRTRRLADRVRFDRFKPSPLTGAALLAMPPRLLGGRLAAAPGRGRGRRPLELADGRRQWQHRMPPAAGTAALDAASVVSAGAGCRAVSSRPSKGRSARHRRHEEAGHADGREAHRERDG